MLLKLEENEQGVTPFHLVEVFGLLLHEIFEYDKDWGLNNYFLQVQLPA